MTNEEMVEVNKAAEQAGLEKHGWYTHIHRELNSDGLVNFHTHGLISKNGKCLDLQIVYPMNHVLANLIFWEFADLLDLGEELKSGQILYIRQFDMTVMLANAIEGGRVVHRIIIPDERGWLQQDQQSDAHGKQWIGAIVA